jgi:hypothetical protein
MGNPENSQCCIPKAYPGQSKRLLPIISASGAREQLEKTALAASQEL